MKGQINSLVKVLVDRYNPQKVILFGSYAWGKPSKDSDIDLFIVKNTKKKSVQRFSDVQKLVFSIQSTTPVEPLVLNPRELKKRLELGDPFILKILREGKVLYGK